MSDLQNHDIQWHVQAKTDSSPIIRVGFWSVVTILVLFLLWAVSFPLSSAVITPGTFVSKGKNKLIQHTVGGRIVEIHVREGQTVQAGQPVVELDRKKAQADLTRLEARKASLSALKSRLDAERSGGLRKMAAAPVQMAALKLRGFSDVAVAGLRGTNGKALKIAVSKNDAELLQSQRDAYASGRDLLDRELEELETRADTLTKQKEGLETRLKAQIALFESSRREYNRLRPLVKDGYIARTRLDERERTLLELEGAISGLKIDVAGVENQVAEVEVQMRKARAENSNVAAREYSKILGELAELADDLIAAKSVVMSSSVRAPVSGTLTRLTTATVGGVVGAGDTIGEIVPDGVPLVVQARVQPSDIDFVQLEQRADIAVTAFNRRVDDTLTGRVVYKSADAEKDEKTGEPFFTVRLELENAGEEQERRLSDVRAGMQSEIYIHTGARTFMAYLTKPMIDSFRRAFREH